MDTQQEWENGWWLHARRAFSPNFSPREAHEKITLAVIHNISLPPFEYGSGAVEQLFTNTLDAAGHPFFSVIHELRVSSHFFISRTGETVQFVSCDDMAYHAGVSSFRKREKCNAFSVGIEMEGCDFEPFTDTQYTALTALLAALSAQYPIEAVTGHQDIAPGRKTDPGHFFDWQRLEEAGLPVVRDAG
ncbi:1,6-anhydro-N-acetylmuramyl-L-alanine amidase AmpD [Neisseria chenwenguii]|uniref:1,6-anhydro-N-acetylmuramyl-L-alanine amidase AmpD n=1 Tax=Neisseria chenwenguii TaxID=1853278 RepID=A0A220S3N4_9NEIS|nr:1,6-anhydro-N-acetylmuramyl-L-alanine amidase AmpD [Neisseria chenwenguii]ASK27825.1 N-acetylmuramoyl-L-alanine amidase [Neisseria chenwenguii]ROV56617.1 1,6-anhydro-N-acetylmuramyl-L-alanine amidase AmpD [Neisseria chenwenguii]